MRLVVAGIVIFLCGCKPASTDVQVLRLAHGLDVSHPVHKAMVYMGHVLDSLSAGAMTVQVYPAQQLGSERECLELLQIGAVDITKVSAAVMENFSPAYQVLSIPYLFENRAHQQAFLEGAWGDSLLQSGKDFRLRGLCFYDAGSRNFYTRERPVERPEDLAGLKLRVQESTTAINMVKALGGSPTPISWGELYTALQQGVVDGAENNAPSFYLSRHYEVCKYYTLNEHTRVPDVLLCAENTWSRLTSAQRQWLQTAARVSADFQQQLWQAEEQRSLNALKEAGIEISYPDQKPFSEACSALIASFEQDPILNKYLVEIKRSGKN